MACSNVFSPVDCAVRTLSDDFEFLWLSAVPRGENAPGRVSLGRPLCSVLGARRGNALPREASWEMGDKKIRRREIDQTVGNVRLPHRPPPPTDPSLLPINNISHPPP